MPAAVKRPASDGPACPAPMIIASKLRLMTRSRRSRIRAIQSRSFRYRAAGPFQVASSVGCPDAIPLLTKSVLDCGCRKRGAKSIVRWCSRYLGLVDSWLRRRSTMLEGVVAPKRLGAIRPNANLKRGDVEPLSGRRQRSRSCCDRCVPSMVCLRIASNMQLRSVHDFKIVLHRLLTSQTPLISVLGSAVRSREPAIRDHWLGKFRRCPELAGEYGFTVIPSEKNERNSTRRKSSGNGEACFVFQVHIQQRAIQGVFRNFFQGPRNVSIGADHFTAPAYKPVGKIFRNEEHVFHHQNPQAGQCLRVILRLEINGHLRGVPA